VVFCAFGGACIIPFVFYRVVKSSIPPLGFFLSFGALQQPIAAVAAAFGATVAEGSTTVPYNSGVGWYLLVWGILNAGEHEHFL
jgi:succinate-acetate transporter protein